VTTFNFGTCSEQHFVEVWSFTNTTKMI